MVWENIQCLLGWQWSNAVNRFGGGVVERTWLGDDRITISYGPLLNGLAESTHLQINT